MRACEAAIEPLRDSANSGRSAQIRRSTGSGTSAATPTRQIGIDGQCTVRAGGRPRCGRRLGSMAGVRAMPAPRVISYRNAATAPPSIPPRSPRSSRAAAAPSDGEGQPARRTDCRPGQAVYEQRRGHLGRHAAGISIVDASGERNRRRRRPRPPRRHRAADPGAAAAAPRSGGPSSQPSGHAQGASPRWRPSVPAPASAFADRGRGPLLRIRESGTSRS